MPLYVVETIQTFRHKYVIDCKEVSHATDTVAMDEASEFSQMYIGEQIISSKEITKDEYHRMNMAIDTSFGDGTHYQPETGSPWMGEKLIHVVNYGTV
jgi:hypothetical protein